MTFLTVIYYSIRKYLTFSTVYCALHELVIPSLCAFYGSTSVAYLAAYFRF